MDPVEKQAIIATASWLFQSSCNNHIAFILALIGSLDEDEPKWSWRSYKRFTIKKLVDVWADEDDGGFNDYLFEFFTRFKKEEVKQLALLFDIPTAFAIDKRTGYVNTVTKTPAEVLLVFLWRSGHPIALAHLMSYFGKSRPWISRVWN
jgi:hypothetical protein